MSGAVPVRADTGSFPVGYKPRAGSSFQPRTQAPPRVPVPSVKRVDRILQDGFFLAAAHGLAQAVPAAKTLVGAEEGEGEKEGHEVIDNPEKHERSEQRFFGGNRNRF